MKLNLQNLQKKVCLKSRMKINQFEEIQKKLLTNCIYLQDEEFTVCGLKFYATPWCPNMYDWLCLKFEKLINQPEKVKDLQNFDDKFFFKNDKELEKIFSKIPEDVDILITHSPPKFILDFNEFGYNRGCSQILAKLLDLHKLKIHLFGHIHSTYGYEFLRRSDVLQAASREKDHNTGQSTKTEPSNDDILFVNAANSHKFQPFYFDV
ncbi:predicted protein [Naegleria gruberi]|uniref:Predicted protein n=1 Tax=Naegleria gruberi TaxID=5762 RepID=D2W023_NAEGR|nr:uncharacterized protein NAEGRDRAFT_74703 [Naegleria gruberi]EFC37496.1 predicted protein [Naegleria gruberi]|eukprot:XP_002670240.1 predicted protein [Naegleria gruberi strain NEG-M]